MNTPLVSVVIPTIPSRRLELWRALISVANQTYENIELLIEKEGTAPEARNHGIQRATGKYIAFLDDDDEWLPGKIAKQVDTLELWDGVDLCITWILDKRFNTERINKTTEYVCFDYVLNRFNLQSTSAYMFRASILKELGGFDTTLPSAQEYDLALRVSKNSIILTVPEVLVVQNKTRGQISENWRRKIQGILALYRKYWRYYTVTNHVKAAGLLVFFLLGYVFRNRIYRIINPIREIGNETTS